VVAVDIEIGGRRIEDEDVCRPALFLMPSWGAVSAGAFKNSPGM